MFSAFQTFGRLGAGARAVAAAWSPSALWPTGTEAGMWIDPSLLTASFNDYLGTTPVATPGTVADSANPVGLALDIRAGAPDVLGPELVTGAPSVLGGNWTDNGNGTYTGDGDSGYVIWSFPSSAAKWHEASFTIDSVTSGSVGAAGGSGLKSAAGTYTMLLQPSADLAIYGASFVGVISGISFKEIPGNHLLQATSTARPLLSAYDGQTLGPGNTYDATGITPFQLYDGTDDGMATASFAAGTLSNAMDCMIAVRRDSAVLPSVCGLYQVDQTKYFGVVGQEPSDSAPTFGNCGSPTIFVDGVSVANTRGALHSAIGVGDWHILEYRDLDLSAWVNAGFGSYGSPYMLDGAQGGVLLFPSSTPTADRDAARTWLGAKVGLTL